MFSPNLHRTKASILNMVHSDQTLTGTDLAKITRVKLIVGLWQTGSGGDYQQLLVVVAYSVQ